MQGERSSSNPFRDNYYFYNNGSGLRSFNLIQLMEAPNPQHDPLAQPDLSEEPGHSITYVDILTREWSISPIIHQGSTTQTFEGSTNSIFPQTNWANSHIMENLIVNGSELQGHYYPMRSFHAAAYQMGRASNIRRGHASSSQARLRLMRRGARRPSSHIRLPTATERRRRFINEELIALGEQLRIIANEVQQIQAIENGLTEDTIMARLSRVTYHPTAAGDGEHRACSICQDEYAEGDLLGKLDCGHDYHLECVKQWLMRKNSCPMCRHRALAI